ncbi:hypothetical protein JCGZ_10898 [Jatropha curcas]|uniref:Uncharacterized protein n=1 Tax=Jatropha curcas TaxID=180498 RepID=A0A067KI77_JATCU|nr:hypothetical protein JCGZ_10898 [Jatropha curcas]
MSNATNGIKLAAVHKENQSVVVHKEKKSFLSQAKPWLPAIGLLAFSLIFSVVVHEEKKSFLSQAKPWIPAVGLLAFSLIFPYSIELSMPNGRPFNFRGLRLQSKWVGWGGLWETEKISGRLFSSFNQKIKQGSVTLMNKDCLNGIQKNLPPNRQAKIKPASFLRPATECNSAPQPVFTFELDKMAPTAIAGAYTTGVAFKNSTHQKENKDGASSDAKTVGKRSFFGLRRLFTC